MAVRGLYDVADWAALAADPARWPAADRAQALSIVRGLLTSTGLVPLAAALRDLGLLPGGNEDVSAAAGGAPPGP